MSVGNNDSEFWFEKQLEKQLRRFAHDLQIPSYRECGRDLCQKVISTLQAEVSKMRESEEITFSIAETIYGGSYAKNTDIMAPDFDLVLRINTSEPIHVVVPEVIANLKRILEKHAVALSILPVQIATTNSCLRFWFTNGIRVDLPIATWRKNPEDILAKVGEVAGEKNKSLKRFYYSSLVEHQVKVITDQSDLAIKVIRLAKLWKSQCNFGNEVRGASSISSIVELISLAAALEEQEKPEKDRSIVQTLMRIFELIANLDTLKLAFRQTDGKWKRVNPEILNAGTLGATPRIVGLPEMLRRKRMIIEPMNPFNDLLEDFDERTINKFMEYGKVMKDRLHGLSRDQKYCVISSGLLVIQYEKLFEPQPLNICEGMSMSFRDALPSHVYLSLDRFQHRRRSSIGQINRPSDFMDMKIRRTDITMKKEVQYVLSLIKTRILGVVTCAAGGLRNMNETTSEEMLKIVGEMLRKMIPSPPVKLTGLEILTGERVGPVATLDAFDVTISMPYSRSDQAVEFCYGIRVSLKWGN